MPPPSELLPEWYDMQGLILSAYDRLPESAYLLFRIAPGREMDAQHWMRENLLPHVTPVEKRARRAGDVTLNIAFTFTGLDKFAALSGQRPVGFSAAFSEGIDGNEHRCRILGDVDGADSTTWRWGGHPHPVDVLVMVFAPDAARLGQWIAAIDGSFGSIGVRRAIVGVNRRDMKLPGSPEGREHFGFVDGVSQPMLAGTDAAERFPESRHLTALGEFVLGYPNAADITPQVPLLTRCASFGRNGSYLVLRQLEQDYAGFWKYFHQQAQGDASLGEHLAEKVIGRRLDGKPLVPMTGPTDNEFGFAEDAHGYGCPMGSHIRRANPRDSFDDTNEPAKAAISANIHRLLRRGRPYGAPYWKDPTAAERGLVFVCLNASIEQQFEFIQQNWVNSAEFLGVAGECDPLIGTRGVTGGRRNCFTIPALPLPARIDTLPSFVRVRGGEYFFLPGLAALEELAG